MTPEEIVNKTRDVFIKKAGNLLIDISIKPTMGYEKRYDEYWIPFFHMAYAVDESRGLRLFFESKGQDLLFRALYEVGNQDHSTEITRDFDNDEVTDDNINKFVEGCVYLLKGELR